MEKTITIKTRDGRFIKGTLSLSETQSDLVIFIHGLFGNPNEHIFYNATKMFRANAICSFRFALYGNADSERQFENMTVSQCALDLNAVIDYFTGKFENVHLVGHSLGAIVILMSDVTNVKRIVLWDPSRNAADVFSVAQYSDTMDAFVFPHAYRTLVSKRMVEDAKRLPKVESLIKEVYNPVKIITAGNAGFYYGKDLYFANANRPKSFCNIRGSGHCFDEIGKEEKLFAATLSWLRWNNKGAF